MRGGGPVLARRGAVVIYPSGTPFAPEVIGTVPEVNAVEVRVGWRCS